MVDPEGVLWARNPPPPLSELTSKESGCGFPENGSGLVKVGKKGPSYLSSKSASESGYQSKSNSREYTILGPRYEGHFSFELEFYLPFTNI